METLYVSNVPDEIYEALRNRARSNRRSIAAEVRILLAENIPTAAELEAREAFVRKLSRFRVRRVSTRRRFPSAEQMQRKDRSR